MVSDSKLVVIKNLVMPHFIIGLLLVVSLSACSDLKKLKFEQNNLSVKITDLENRVKNIEWEADIIREYELEKNQIDLSYSRIQSIGEDGIHIFIESVNEHLTGLKIKGHLINTLGTTIINPTLRIRVGGNVALIDKNTKIKEFDVNNIPSGGSVNFEVYVPEISPSDAKNAIINVVNSGFSYKKPIK